MSLQKNKVYQQHHKNDQITLLDNYAFLGRCPVKATMLFKQAVTGEYVQNNG